MIKSQDPVCSNVNSLKIKVNWICQKRRKMCLHKRSKFLKISIIHITVQTFQVCFKKEWDVMSNGLKNLEHKFSKWGQSLYKIVKEYLIENEISDW